MYAIRSYYETHINLNGNLKNILGGDQMLIDVVFSDTYFHPDDPNMLLRTIDIPVYADYGILIFDSLYFKGKPLQFNSGMYVETERGNFDGIVTMDLLGKEMKYNIVLFTQRLDLSPVINIETNLNSHITLKGIGTSPDT